jgi:phosphoribosylcarboxyaminoimidazole (NCAIR) mutase
MPSGIAPALVLEPINAALLVAKIFGQFIPEIKEAVIKFQRAQAVKIIEDDAQLGR